MDLKIIGTGSQGNAYLLETENEALLIECGVRFDLIKRSIDFNLSKLVGCILTHEHGDHAKSVKEVMSNGVDLYASLGTLEALKISNYHRAFALPSKTIKIGNFKVKSFEVPHDAAEPQGFLISHPECGKVLFLTDAMYCPFLFYGLNNIIIEANFSREIMTRKLSEMEFLKNRILQSHMSIETCIKTLQANDLSAVNNIVLIHLSDSNSNEINFKQQVVDATLKNVNVASNGMTIPFNKTPF